MRITLNLKHIEYEMIPIHLLKNHGENWKPGYKAINPQGLVPALEDQNQVFIQSAAIIEYLEETYPNPSILPSSSDARAYVRAISQIIACDIHPLNNLRVLNYLQEILHCSVGQKNSWYHYWINEGLAAIEKYINKNNFMGKFCCGDSPTLADIFLIPQVYNAKRFDCDINKFPVLNKINKECLNLKEFSSAAPENQPDSE